MKRLLTLLFFAFFAISSYGQVQPNLPPGTVPFGTGLFRAPDGDIWGGSKFDGYTNLGNWQRVADSLRLKINWSDTTVIASKEWVHGQIEAIPVPDYPVESVTGTGVDISDPKNPVIDLPTPSEIGALAPGDNISELNNDVPYLDTETDPVFGASPAAGIEGSDISAWNAKQDAITGAATTIDTENLTVNRAVISNGSGKIAVSPVTSTQLSYLTGATSNIQDQLDDKIPLSQKGASNGVAPIGSDGKIPGEYLPSSGSYKGTWDASTNTPTIADGVGTNGDRYRVSVGGTVNLGSGNITFVAGDDVIYNGSIWQRSPSGVTVTSVAGKTGDVVLDKSDVGLSNVDNTSDLDKPISTAVQNALDLKVDATTLSDYYTKTNLQTSGQAAVHWGNITNVSGLFSTSYSSPATATNYSGDLESIPLGNFSANIASASANKPWSSGGGALISFGNVGQSARLSVGLVGDNFYYDAGSSPFGETYQVASREWVNSLSGVAQTLNLTTGGVLQISGGNTVYLNGLGDQNTTPASDMNDFSGAGFGAITTTTLNLPPTLGASRGGFIQMTRVGNPGKFQMAIGNGGDIHTRVASGTEWSTWREYGDKTWVNSNYVSLATDQLITGVKTFSKGLRTTNSGSTAIYLGGNSAIGGVSGSVSGKGGGVYLSTYAQQDESNNSWTAGNASVASGLLHVTRDGNIELYTAPAGTSPGNFATFWGSPRTVWHSGNLNPADFVSPETVISTTVNFTIDWQNDIAPNSGGKTYAELHGNHFVYSAFYNDGSGGEVNYSPAVKITRSSGNITTVQFGDIQTGNIVIK